MKKSLGAELLLFLGAAHALCQDPAAAGSTLKYFSSVDDGVYKGSKPKSDADYRFLQSLHVKYIVDLQILPLLTRFE